MIITKIITVFFNIYHKLFLKYYFMNNSSLYEMYQAQVEMDSHAKQFIKEIMDLTHRSESTVRKWLSGAVEPDERIKRLLAKHFNTEVDVLFPLKGMRYGK